MIPKVPLSSELETSMLTFPTFSTFQIFLFYSKIGGSDSSNKMRRVGKIRVVLNKEGITYFTA